MSAPQTGSDGTLASALALQRVLALEGRNALARVELAASELDRFELSPSIQDRITAIREAVGELDGLLDKIERLADPARPETGSVHSRPAGILTPLLARIAPALAARGVVIAVEGGLASASVALPAAVLERLFLTWLRLAISTGDESEAGADAEPSVLRLSTRETLSQVAFILEPTSSARALRVPCEPSQQVELDVALAEWRASAHDGDPTAGAHRTLLLPRSTGDA